MRTVLIMTFFLLPGLASASTLGDAIAGPVGGSLLFCGLVIVAVLFGALCRQASVYFAERTHASRVARLMDVLASQADGIVGMLLAHPPSPTATLAAVREAAIAHCVAYAKTNLPDTIAQIGVSDGVLAARLSNEVASKILATAPPPPPYLIDGGLAAVVPQPAATPAA